MAESILSQPLAGCRRHDVAENLDRHTLNGLNQESADLGTGKRVDGPLNLPYRLYV
jgi:hypothetical protein